jgi:DNA-binding response OmpR family regulator
VVDDDEDLRAAIAEYLEMHGFETLQAGNGLDALLTLKRARPAAVVLDILMPRLGGLQALKRIQDFDPQVAVIVVTGTTDPELQRLAAVAGARAVLTKPVALADIVRLLREGAPAAKPEPLVAGRILLVDDEPALLDMYTDFLTEQHYEVRTATDGETAIKTIGEWEPDIVLLDIQMPGPSGVESLATIRALAPDVKVIMVSGISDTDLARRALAYGAFDYVTKPVDLEYLGRSVGAALLMRRHERS